MRIIPPQSRTPLVAVVTIDGQTIGVALPARDEPFVAAVKALGYTWSRRDLRWWRAIQPAIHGSVTDRAVELMTTLLAKGYPVACPDDLVPAVQAGQYAPEHRRWVLARAPGAPGSNCPFPP